MSSLNTPGFSAGQSGGAPLNQWTPQQLLRLENEWRRLQRMFAYHPVVRVVPLAGDPPDQYQIEYRLKSILYDANGQLQYASSAAVHIWLPPEFPHEPPLVRPISAIFHPNVVSEGIAISRAWVGPTSTLVDVVTWVGRLLAWQEYDADALWNETAVGWLQANSQLVPVDAQANLFPDAGGDALARICRFGPRTLEQAREQAKKLCDALLLADGAAAEQTPQFVQRTRQALSLFLEEDVPESLRTPAGELDDFVRGLVSAPASWEALRRGRGAAEAALGIARQLRDVEQSAEHEMSAIDAMGATEAAADALALIRQLPSAGRLQMVQGNLVNLLTRGEQLLADGKAAAQQLITAQNVDLSAFTGMLLNRLQTEQARIQELTADATVKLNAAAVQFNSARAQARLYAAAMKRASDWRALADLLDRGRELMRKVLALGAGGMQAFFVESESGSSGPHELEQPIKVGPRMLAVRNPGAISIEVIDAQSGLVLGRSETGALALPIRDGQQVHRVTLRLTGNCDETAVQLDYIIRESRRILSEGAESERGPKSWLGKMVEQLGREETRAAIAAEHEELEKRWTELRDDLRSLSPFRERMATWRMIERVSENGGRLAAELAAEEQSLAESTQRVGLIVAASSRDMETGQLRVPAKYAKEYPQQLQRRQLAQQRITRLKALVSQAVKDVQSRTDDPRRRGFADWPALVMLGNVPESWRALAGQMSDSAMARRLSDLENKLGIKLVPEGLAAGEAPAQAVAAAPAAPPEVEAAGPVAVEAPVEDAASQPPTGEGEFAILANDEIEESANGEELIDFDPNAERNPGEDQSRGV